MIKSIDQARSGSRRPLNPSVIMDGSLQALEQQISKATSDDSRVEILHTALTEWFANHSGNSSLLQLGGIPLTNVIRPEDPIHPQDLILTQGIYALATKYGVFERLSTRFALGKLSGLADWEDSWAKPIEHLPCAHIRPNDRYKCLELGTRACSGCRLVSYCSAVRLLGLYRASSYPPCDIWLTSK